MVGYHVCSSVGVLVSGFLPGNLGTRNLLCVPVPRNPVVTMFYSMMGREQQKREWKLDSNNTHIHWCIYTRREERKRTRESGSQGNGTRMYDSGMCAWCEEQKYWRIVHHGEQPWHRSSKEPENPYADGLKLKISCTQPLPCPKMYKYVFSQESRVLWGRYARKRKHGHLYSSVEVKYTSDWYEWIRYD